MLYAYVLWTIFKVKIALNIKHPLEKILETTVYMTINIYMVNSILHSIKTQLNIHT